jgi:hypothetical protein
MARPIDFGPALPALARRQQLTQGVKTTEGLLAVTGLLLVADHDGGDVGNAGGVGSGRTIARSRACHGLTE